jgi:GntR family transcriptional regulator
MGLSFQISTGTTAPIYRQIVEQVRRGVLGGSLPVGTALPSVRALAEQLVVNPNTVARAYQELTGDGLIQSQPGRGYFVSEKRAMFTTPERRRRLREVLEPFVSEALTLQFSSDEILRAVRERLQEYQIQSERANR